MGTKVLILGESGTGKSASMRNFQSDEVLLINVAKKSLPFKTKGGKFETLNSDDYLVIQKKLKATDKKVIVVDDSQYLMANEFMRRATEKGFDKFTEIAQNYWELMQVIDNLPDDKIVYVLSHIERDQSGNEKIKTIGKLLDEKITVEGMYAIVLKTMVTDGKYYFQTQNSGTDTCKSPMGLFSTFLIDNDLKMVDTLLRDYYDLSGTNSEQLTMPLEETKVEPVKEQPKSLAEKLAEEVKPVEPPKRKVEAAIPERKVRTLEEKVAEFNKQSTEEVEQPVTRTRTRTRARA